jgi:hypothetical protein
MKSYPGAPDYPTSDNIFTKFAKVFTIQGALQMSGLRTAVADKIYYCVPIYTYRYIFFIQWTISGGGNLIFLSFLTNNGIDTGADTVGADTVGTVATS